MVFGWGKKQEQNISEKIERKEVEIKFTEIEKVLEDKISQEQDKVKITEKKIEKTKEKVVKKETKSAKEKK